MAGQVLLVKELTKKNNKIVFDKINMNVGYASIYGLLGRENSGKTTLLKIICGLLNYDKGHIFVDGNNILTQYEKVREVISYIPSVTGFYNNLNSLEYLLFFANSMGIYGIDARKCIYDICDLLVFENCLERDVNDLNKYEKEKLNLARALINNPKLILIDDPIFIKKANLKEIYRQIFKELSLKDVSVVIASNNINNLSNICTHLGIIDNSRMIKEGTINHIMDEIEKSHPIKIEILDGISVAMNIFKNNSKVTSITRIDKTFSVGFNGSNIDEAMLLNELIVNDVAVRNFVRITGDLDDFIIRYIDDKNEKVIMKNDY